MQNRCTEVSFTTPEVMRTLIMKLPHTEVKFYPEVKSQTGLSSLRVSCKRALILSLDIPLDSHDKMRSITPVNELNLKYFLIGRNTK